MLRYLTRAFESAKVKSSILSSKKVVYTAIGGASIYTSVLVIVNQNESLKKIFQERVPYGDRQLQFANDLYRILTFKRVLEIYSELKGKVIETREQTKQHIKNAKETIHLKYTKSKKNVDEMKSSVFSKLSTINESTHRGLEHLNESKQKIHAIATSTIENISHGFESSSESARGIKDKLVGMTSSIVGVFSTDDSDIKSSEEKLNKSGKSYGSSSFPKSQILVNTETNYVENQPTPIKTDKNPTIKIHVLENSTSTPEMAQDDKSLVESTSSKEMDNDKISGQPPIENNSSEEAQGIEIIASTSSEPLEKEELSINSSENINKEMKIISDQLQTLHEAALSTPSINKKLLENINHCQTNISNIMGQSSSRPAFLAFLESLTLVSESLKNAISSDTSLNMEKASELYMNVIKHITPIIVEEHNVLEKFHDKLVNEHVLDELVLSKALEKQKWDMDLQFDKILFEQREILESKHLVDIENKVNEQASKNSMEMKESLERQLLLLEYEFENLLQQEIQRERCERQDKVDDLALKTLYLEQISQKNAQNAKRGIDIVQLQTCITSLKSAFGKREFSKQVQNIKSFGKNNALLNTLCDVIEEHREGVLSQEELSERFGNLKRYLQWAQYMPNNGGPLSYMFSKIMSFFTLKKGMGKGSDTTSTIGRVEYYLQHGNLDSAARELNQLDGKWAKILCQEWMNSARKHLEVKQAIDVSLAIYND